MKIYIYSLAEGESFWHILFNALGYRPLPTYDTLRIMATRPDTDVRMTLERIAEQGAELEIAHIFRPFDSPSDDSGFKETEQYQMGLDRHYHDNAIVFLRELLKRKIPFRLIPSKEMEEELRVLLRHSPPLYERALEHLQEE